MRRSSSDVDPDDMFADTRMTFGDHIEELRAHMLRAIYGFLIGMAISFAFGSAVVHFITRPVEDQLMVFYNRRVEKIEKELLDGDAKLKALNEPKDMAMQIKVATLKDSLKKIGIEAPKAADDDDEWIEFPVRYRPLEVAIATHSATTAVLRPPQLATMDVMEGFMVYMKVSAFTGLVISSPWVFWQMWMFVAAGLYPQEKKYVHKYLPVSLVLFLVGVVVCEFIVIPRAIAGLLWFNEWLGLEPELRLNEWLSFALILPLVFGLAFQTPLVMLFMAKLGIMDVDDFRKKRRIAWFVMSIFSAIFTPADIFSMLMMLVPMCLLYELGIVMVKYGAKPEKEEFEEPADQYVEV